MAWNFNFFKKATEQMDTVRRAVMRYMGIEAQWGDRNYEGFAKEGYNMNVWVYACVQAIATGVSSVPWKLYKKKANGEREELLDHDLLKLLNKPNQFASRAEFFEAYAAYYLISGNSFIHIDKPLESGDILSLWLYRPDCVKVLNDGMNEIIKYEITIGDQRMIVDLNRISHLKTFNPLNAYYGLSPIEAAARGIDNNNAANAWNNALLNNGARPGGALVTEQSLTQRQYDLLKENLDKNHVGTRNAGKPMILEGGLKWQEMSFNPKDMDFILAKKMTTIEICAAFRVPPEIVGYGETKTYSNYQEARKALYEDAILPMLDKMRDKLNNDLVSLFGSDLELDYEKDGIEALQENRDAVYTRAIEAYQGGLITKNEGRNEMGYDDDPNGGDEYIAVPVAPIPPEKDPKKVGEEGKKSRFFQA